MSAAASSQPVEVRILDREYHVACPPEEREGLIAAARLLDARMREIRSGNRMAGIDRIAVLAALNLAHDYQQLQQGAGALDRTLVTTLGDLNRRLETLLASAESAR